MTDTPLFLDSNQLINVLNQSKTPTAVHIGENAIIQYANDAMLNVWGKDRSVIGLSLEDALPELKGQPFIEMFARVWREGLVIAGTDTAADLIVNGQLQTFYFDFEYRAIRQED
ncbi:MAG: PAS domain-containing protein, partial [Bacteroidia bacterium]